MAKLRVAILRVAILRVAILRVDRVLLPLALPVVVVPFVLGFVSVARNRLVSGRPVSLWAAEAGAPLWLGVAAALLLLVGVVRSRAWPALVGAGLLIAALIWTAGHFAEMTAMTTPSARVAFAAGFWIMLGCCLLCMAEAARRLGSRAALVGFLLVVGAVGVMLATGLLSELSLLREYENKREILGPALLRHIGIVAAAMAPTLAIGIPLGVACHRAKSLGAAVFPTLGLVQTIPSIALFGLLMAPLSGIAAWWPALGRAGFGGIGIAPAVIALVLYSLLPITRNTTSGLDGVPASVRDAAVGLGMRPAQVFWQVDVKLAFPALLAGLRVTLVQAIGLAAVAALIGAGGLGSVMFDGLFTGALDLVLLGALPVIGLAVATDLLLRAAVSRRAVGA